MIGTTTDPKQEVLYHMLAALSLQIIDNIHEHFLFPVKSLWKNCTCIERQNKQHYLSHNNCIRIHINMFTSIYLELFPFIWTFV